MDRTDTEILETLTAIQGSMHAVRGGPGERRGLGEDAPPLTNDPFGLASVPARR